jgi:hypothetical protein
MEPLSASNVYHCLGSADDRSYELNYCLFITTVGVVVGGLLLEASALAS